MTVKVKSRNQRKVKEAREINTFRSHPVPWLFDQRIQGILKGVKYELKHIFVQILCEKSSNFKMIKMGMEIDNW